MQTYAFDFPAPASLITQSDSAFSASTGFAAQHLRQAETAYAPVDCHIPTPCESRISTVSNDDFVRDLAQFFNSLARQQRPLPREAVRLLEEHLVELC